MSLSDQDESDLAGLASGLGPPDADQRARDLMQRDPEAAEYFRQMRVITECLEPEESSAPLSSEQADMLAAAVMERATRPRPRQPLRVRHPWRWAGLAAAVAGTVMGWFIWGRLHPPQFAELVVLDAGMHVGIGLNNITRSQLRPGQMIETKGDYAIVELARGRRVIAGPGTKFGFDKDYTLIYVEGDLFIEAPLTIQCQISHATVRIDGSRPQVGIRWYSGGPGCSVFAGSAVVSCRGKTANLTVGHLAHWGNTEREISIVDIKPDTPGWVRLALDLAAKE